MKKKKKEEAAETHPDLKGLRMKVDAFGRIDTSISLDRINDFLDRNVIDKKLNEKDWENKKKKALSKAVSDRSGRRRKQ